METFEGTGIKNLKRRGGELAEGFLGDGQHAAGAGGAIVEEAGPGFDLVGDRQEDEVGHAAQDAHGQDDVGVFAAPKEVAQDVVGKCPR